MPSFHKDVLFITTYMLVFMLLFSSSKMSLIKGDIFILKIQLVKFLYKIIKQDSAWFFVVSYSQRIIFPCEYHYGLDCDWPGRVFNISKCSEGLFPLVLLNICVFENFEFYWYHMYMGLDLIVLWMLYIKLKKYMKTRTTSIVLFSGSISICLSGYFL